MKDKFDQILRDTLSSEEKEIWDDLLGTSPLQLVTDTFRSRNRWLNVLGFVAGFLFFIAGICTLTGFVAADEPLAAIRWGLAFVGSMWGLWATKVWGWMEIQRNALTREIKRLELQIVHLSSRVDSTKGKHVGGTTTD
jgi:hypothetical protein